MASARQSTALHLSRTAILIAFLTLWQLASTGQKSRLFFSSPLEIWQTFLRWVLDGTLLHHASITAAEALLGFLLGSVLGVGAGLLLGRNPFLSKVLSPFISAIYSLPKVALAPLFVLWFGIDIQMKILLTAAIVFFLVFTNTMTGVREVDHEQILILRLMGARERHVMTKVVMPSAFVWVLTGLNLSVPYALIGAIVGELVASNRGLGYLIADAAGQFDTAGVFASLIAILIVSALMNGAVRLLEHIVAPWRFHAARNR